MGYYDVLRNETSATQLVACDAVAQGKASHQGWVKTERLAEVWA